MDVVVTILFGTTHQRLPEIFQEVCHLSREFDLETVLYSDTVTEVKGNENASFVNPLELG